MQWKCLKTKLRLLIVSGVLIGALSLTAGPVLAEDAAPGIESVEAPEEAGEFPEIGTLEEETPVDPIKTDPETTDSDTGEEPEAPETTVDQPDETLPVHPTEDVGVTETETNKTEIKSDALPEMDAEVITQAKEEAEKREISTQELIAAQNIRRVVPVLQDWRMVRVKDARVLYATKGAYVYEAKTTKSRMVGLLEEGRFLYVLSDEGDGWLYVESGRVRGFLQTSRTCDKEQAERWAKRKSLRRIAKKNKGEVCHTESFLQPPRAIAYVPPGENAALCYKRITATNAVRVDPALVASDLAEIRETVTKGGRAVGSLQKGDLVYLICRVNAETVFVESGDVRGFLDAGCLDISWETRESILAQGEETYPQATVLVPQEKNAAWWYSIVSIKEGSADAAIRQELLEFAQQFVGNPYVFGGNDLYHGIDCSAFVQQIYRRFGVELPRIADAQSRVGTQIPVSDASPGDLLFWAENGYVYHVAMYAGNGETIEAYSSEMGIVHIKRNIETAVWATRLL